ncbi:hypothetical protein DFH11DRAFT_1740160 [Phellopilus nigrolimitatus]|nr:hypothetical protein DFH11DRAFT_1740160 [Phellopilus nigrolimitatus]
MNACPNVETLLFPSLCPHTLNWCLNVNETFHDLKVVGLHWSGDAHVENWSRVKRYFDAFLANYPTFQNVQKIELHGWAWASLVDEDNMKDYMIYQTDMEGVEISFIDPSAALVFKQAREEKRLQYTPDEERKCIVNTAIRRGGRGSMRRAPYFQPYPY